MGFIFGGKLYFGNFARTPDGVRTAPVSICATKPGRPKGLLVTEFVMDARVILLIDFR
jgi:hypothetical protein